MKRLVVTGSFPFTTHTFVIREVASAHAAGDEIYVLAPDDGDRMGEEFRASLGFPADRAIYLDYSRCSPFALDVNWFRADLNRAAMRSHYGWMLAARRKAFFCKLMRDSRLGNLDLIHAHFASWAFRVAAPLAEILEVPMTVTAHEAELFPRLGREMLAYLQARAEFITFDSSGAMEEWTAISGSSQRLRLVHQGVDLGEFESIARFGRRVDPEAPVRLMSVARLTPHKRIADAVRAVRELIDEGLNVTYSIVSDGPERATLEAMCADLGLGGHVSFLGFVSRGRLVSELSDADLFVHPSAAEGFGVAVVEAMASGLPVVVANSLGVRDIVDDGNDGYLYEPGDVARLAALLSLLVRNPQMRQTFGRRGREAVFARFAWSRHMEQMNDVWREARRSVAEGGRGR